MDTVLYVLITDRRFHRTTTKIKCGKLQKQQTSAAFGYRHKQRSILAANIPAAVSTSRSETMRVPRPSFLHPPSLLRVLPRFVPRRRIHLLAGDPSRRCTRMLQPRATTTTMAATLMWRRTIFAVATTTTTPRSTGSSSSNGIGRIRCHGGGPGADAPTVSVTFLQPDGITLTKVTARVGESLLQTAHRHEIDLEGACEGG